MEWNHTVTVQNLRFNVKESTELVRSATNSIVKEEQSANTQVMSDNIRQSSSNFISNQTYLCHLTCRQQNIVVVPQIYVYCLTLVQEQAQKQRKPISSDKRTSEEVTITSD